MEADEKTLLGPVHGKFKFKLPDGTVDSNTVICNLCSKEFSNHRSSSTLKYRHVHRHFGGQVLKKKKEHPSPKLFMKLKIIIINKKNTEGGFQLIYLFVLTN